MFSPPPPPRQHKKAKKSEEEGSITLEKGGSVENWPLRHQKRPSRTKPFLPSFLVAPDLRSFSFKAAIISQTPLRSP